MKRPYIICHMMASLDGRIDCEMTEKIEPDDSYYNALEELRCPSMMCGRVTAEMHYARKGHFEPRDPQPIGRTACCVARESAGYMIVVDTLGRLTYDEPMVEGLPLLVITSERASEEYLDHLSAMGISWVAAGDEKIQMREALEMLHDEFGIHRVAAVGGGHLNGSLLALGILDEISMMYAPGIDGRRGQTAAFDGLNPEREPVRLKLKSVSQFESGTIWMRYSTRLHE